jgi:hypothetical protein
LHEGADAVTDRNHSLFPSIARTAWGHFTLCYLAAVFRVMHRCRAFAEEAGAAPDSVFDSFPFLKQEYLADFLSQLPEPMSWADAAQWWPEALQAWEESCPVHLPLRSLREQAALSFDELMALLIASLVEEDGRFGPLFDSMQPEQTGRPTAPLLARLAAGEEAGGAATDLSLTYQPLLTAGLLTVRTPTAPRSSWVLVMPPLLWDLVRGQTGAPLPHGWRYSPPDSQPDSADLLLPPDLRARVTGLPPLLQARQIRTVIIRGAPGSERLPLAGALARSAGRGLLHVDAPPAGGSATEEPWVCLGPACTLLNALPVFEYDLGPGETARLPDLPGYSGPVLGLVTPAGGVQSTGGGGVQLELPLPPAATRQQLWERHLPEAAPGLTAAAARWQVPAGTIASVAAGAVSRAAVRGSPQVELSDVSAVARELQRQALDHLATRLEAAGSWSDLVVSPTVARKLQQLEWRCRFREALLGHLGPAYSSHQRGVRALFSGPSGTGKTLGARVLAAVLGMEIYRVDVSAVMNKYIGETEKNLNQVLSRAEELDVVLLLDEGDSLLGKRSDVRSSNDRYANLQTNYLLQRLEAYQGIVLITTNAPGNIDTAFARRIDVSIEFAAPQPQERLQLWKLHLPPNLDLQAGALDEVALRCALAGGQIRNAALQATLLAMADGAAVTRSHLVEAVRDEYNKAGAICPL